WITGNLCELSKGYFATTFLSSSLTCPASQSGLWEPCPPRVSLLDIPRLITGPPITLQKAVRHIVPPKTPARARRRVDSRTGSAESVPRTESRRESGATTSSATRTCAQPPTRGAMPCRNSNRGSVSCQHGRRRSARGTDKKRRKPQG